MSEQIIHAFEAGRRGKPDELDAGIAHLVGAYFLEQDPSTRFDLRVSGSYNLDLDQPVVKVSGEVSATTLAKENMYQEITDVILDHYNQTHRTELSREQFIVGYNFKPQMGILATNDKAGDSGDPIAVAYKDGPLHLPWERYLAVELRDLVDGIYQLEGLVPPTLASRAELKEVAGLRADGKISVQALYEEARFRGIERITFAVEHEANTPLEELRQEISRVVRAQLREWETQYGQSLGNPKIIINGHGAWHQGGWKVDEGSREAKSYRDGFGSYGVMEDSFSGEDPTKPSGTGTFLARYIAVQIVANDLADFARVALTYTIGQDEVGLNVTTQGTGKLPQQELHQWVRKNIPLRINDGIELFCLRNPRLYQEIVASSDFFHDPLFPWNEVKVKYTPKKP